MCHSTVRGQGCRDAAVKRGSLGDIPEHYRFSDTSFATDDGRRAVAGGDILPEPVQNTSLVVATSHQRGGPSRHDGSLTP